MSEVNNENQEQRADMVTALKLPCNENSIEVVQATRDDLRSWIDCRSVGGESIDGSKAFNQPEDYDYRYALFFDDEFLVSGDLTKERYNPIASTLHNLQGYAGNIYGNAYLTCESETVSEEGIPQAVVLLCAEIGMLAAATHGSDEDNPLDAETLSYSPVSADAFFHSELSGNLESILGLLGDIDP